MEYKIGEPIPRLDYTEEENQVWKFCYERLSHMFKTNACEEFNWSINEFRKEIGLNGDEIPQLEDISAFL